VRGREYRGLLAALALVAVLLAGLASAAAGAPSQTRTLRVGFFGSFDEAAIGDELAFATLRRQTGLGVSFSTFVSPQAAVIAVTRGDVDIGITGLHSTVAAINEGAPLRALLVAKQVNEWVFVADATSLAALRGRKIGYQTPGTETEAFAKVLLRRAGLRPGDVELTALPGSPNRAIALLNGSLGAAWLNYVDFLRVVGEKPSLRALASARSLVPFSALHAVVVSESFLQTNRPLLQRVVTALLQGYEELYRPAGKARWLARAQATVFKDDPATAARVYASYRRIGLWPRTAAPVTKAQWESRVLFWLAGDIVSSVPEFDRVWDLSFWRTAARQQAPAGSGR
jgi:NitT/TauT family transport system substrate-binding protein